MRRGEEHILGLKALKTLRLSREAVKHFYRTFGRFQNKARRLAETGRNGLRVTNNIFSSRLTAEYCAEKTVIAS